MTISARVIQNDCWPHSGRQFSVWHHDKAVLQTNDLDEANRKVADLNRLSLHVWWCEEWTSWGVTEYRGDDPQDTESDWHHLKRSARMAAEKRFYNDADEVEEVVVFSKTGTHQETLTRIRLGGRA